MSEEGTLTHAYLCHMLLIHAGYIKWIGVFLSNMKSCGSLSKIRVRMIHMQNWHRINTIIFVTDNQRSKVTCPSSLKDLAEPVLSLGFDSRLLTTLDSNNSKYKNIQKIISLGLKKKSF